MVKGNKSRENEPLSVFRKKSEELTYLVRALKESEEKYQQLQEKYLRLYKDFSGIEKTLRDSKERHKELCQEIEEKEEELSYIKFKEAIERYILKETYSFLLSEGYKYNYKINLWQRMEQSNTKDGNNNNNKKQ